VERDWRLKEQFVVRDLQSALTADALSTSHPITQSVDSPNSIRSIFDTISYEKGIYVPEIRLWFCSVF
jgi:aminopeptidase N